jgi:hypothetical protein
VTRNYSFVKSEIAFFMERSFQVSLGYFASLAVVIVTAINIRPAVFRSWGLPEDLAEPTVISGVVVLLLNVLYLSIAIACLFAILKRGLFLIEHDEMDDHRTWETFVRGGLQTAENVRPISNLSWNVDNYYMLPMFALVLVSSGVSAYITISAGSVASIIGIALVVCHAVPIWMLTATGRVNRLARERSVSLPKHGNS